MVTITIGRRAREAVGAEREAHHHQGVPGVRSRYAINTYTVIDSVSDRGSRQLSQLSEDRVAHARPRGSSFSPRPGRPAPAGSHSPTPRPMCSEPNSATLYYTAPSASTKPAAVPFTNRGWCIRIAMVQTSSLWRQCRHQLPSECEPQCPALHNRSFRPSWFTQPPAGAHVSTIAVPVACHQ